MVDVVVAVAITLAAVAVVAILFLSALHGCCCRR